MQKRWKNEKKKHELKKGEELKEKKKKKKEKEINDSQHLILDALFQIVK